MKIINNILSEAEIQTLVRQSLDYKPSTPSTCKFQLPISDEMKSKLRTAFNAAFVFENDMLCMRWIKGDTPPHIDKNSANESRDTYIVYLSDDKGTLHDESNAYPIAKGVGYVIERDTLHWTENSSEPKLLIGPMTKEGLSAGPACVTVYGILDMGYFEGSGVTQGNESASRLGFRGSEDLGGGVSAFFTLETGLTPQSNTLSQWNNRQSFVGLKQNGLGQTAIGTQYTPIHLAVTPTDVGGLNNMRGNVIYPIGGSTATTQNLNDTTGAYTTRYANSVSLQSDSFAGFSVGGIFAVDNKTANDTTAWGGNVNYTGNGFQATSAYQTAKNTTAGGAFGLGQNSKDDQWYAGATYDCGILKAYVNYVNRKATSISNPNEYTSRSAEQIGVRSFISPAIEGWASYGMGRSTPFGISEPTANFSGYQLGSNYWLSKRTNLYGIFGSTESTTASANNYSVGVRHSF